MTFADISLLPEELQLLKALKRHGPRALTEQELAYSNSLLTRFHFIQSEHGALSISKEGLRYLRFRREDAFRHRWPVYLSIASFIVSVVSLAISLFK